MEEEEEEEEDGTASEEHGTTSPPEPWQYHSNSHSCPSSPSYKYQIDDFLWGLIKTSNRYGSANARLGRIPSLATPSSSNVEDDDPYRSQHRRSTMNPRSSYTADEGTGYRNRESKTNSYHTIRYIIKNRRIKIRTITEMTNGLAYNPLCFEPSPPP